MRRRIHLWSVLALVLLCLGVSVVGGGTDEVQAEFSRLQGEWRLADYAVLVPQDHAVPTYEGRFKGSMVISDRACRMNITIATYPELRLNPKIVVRPTLDPKEWDATHVSDDGAQSRTSRCIYSLKDDTLMISFFRDPAAKERPKSFDGPVTTGQTIMTWKRVPKREQ